MKQSQKLLESFQANLKKSQNLKEGDSKEDFEVVIGDTVDEEPFWYDMMNEYNLNIKITPKDSLNILVTIKGDKSEIQKLIKNGFNPNELTTVKEEYPELFESFKANLKEDNEEEFYGGGANEKVGGDYDDFIYELSNFRAIMNNWYDQCSTGLAKQIVEETIMSFDNLLTRYEQQKDIEIHGAMNESQKLNEDEGFKHFDNEESVKAEFTNPIIFTPDKIEQNGTGELSKCKFNSINANETNPEENPDIYVGYVVLEDKNGSLIGFKHYWNGKNDIAIDHTDVKSNSLYNQGKLVYYIGEKVN